jgi:hypothetical protein
MPDVAEHLRAGAQLSALGPSYIPLTSAPIHRSAWNKNSANFVMTEFSDVVAPASQICYLTCKSSGGERVGEGEEKACDD